MKKKHVKWLREGVESWNKKRREYDFQPDLADADLRDGNFENANFTGADLSHADMRKGKFARANFTNANLSEANIKDADLSEAVLTGVADITGVFPLKSVLFPSMRGPDPVPRFPEKVKSVGNLLKRCRTLKKHYKPDSSDKYFNEYSLLYFRGERGNSWDLEPSAMRDEDLQSGKETFFWKKEGEMLLDLMSRRPEDFVGVSSAISQWVIAQQHGLKTRLLDITRNPLVALFHSCREYSVSGSSDPSDGILHVFAVPKNLVKAFDSDTVSIIANLAKLPRFEQDMLMGLSDLEEFDFNNESGRPNDYSIVMDRLYHYIRREKPYFEKRIDIRHMFQVFVVEPEQSFERIKAQSGAFLISAFHKRFETEQIRKSVSKANANIPLYHHYKLTVPAECKENILDELELLNVKREVLFPSLDEAAEAVVRKDEYYE